MGVDGSAIGIDLGTTYSRVAVWRPVHNRVEVIPNDHGNNATPSYIAFTDSCWLIGDAAMNQAAMNPANTVFGENHTSIAAISTSLLLKVHSCVPLLI
jgi:L1 cell adhesion molecule like protein